MSSELLVILFVFLYLSGFILYFGIFTVKDIKEIKQNVKRITDIYERWNKTNENKVQPKKKIGFGEKNDI